MAGVPRREQMARKMTIKTITGGAAKWFPTLTSVSFEENGVDAQGNKVLRLKNEPPILPLCKILGFTSTAKGGASEFGEFIKFGGQFRGTNLADGVVSEAAQCLLPPFVADGLFAALQNPDRKGSVQFAIEIGVQYDDTAVAKY
jgi:hypothetical protein